MTVHPHVFNLPLEGLRRLTGPVLDKELRVLSRQKRTYWLRGLYPILLVLIVSGAWIVMRIAAKAGPTSLALSGMDRLARSVVSAMVWLQFMLCQFMAVVLVSSAMSDEVRRRSLSALMTTPLRPVQILFGKLMGPLMTVWTLLALSCPFLALVRVWGGIPWEFLVSTLAVTVCVTLCMATLSLLLSLWFERPHKVVLLVLSVVIIGFMSGILLVRSGWQFGNKINPWAVFMGLSMEFHSAGTTGKTGWQEHCLLMLGLASAFFGICILCLRKRALAHVSSVRRKRSLGVLLRRMLRGGRARPEQAIRSVAGAPLLWKELGSAPGPYLLRQIPWIILLLAILIACLVLPHLLMGGSGQMGVGVYGLTAAAIGLLVMLRTTTMAAWCVAQEKEAQAWPVLLCTTLPDIWILRHKALSVIMKNAAGWIALAIASLVYICLIPLWYGDRAYSMGLGAQALGSFVGRFASLYMVTGVGLYFSIRMRSGALAVAATLGFLIVSRVLLQFLMIPLVLVIGAVPGVAQGLQYVFLILNPVASVLVGAIMFKLCAKALRKYVF
jgi:ABC-type transport system involved in multi-copper enzyme maturation permease subunit